MTLRSISRKGFKSREFSSHKILVDLSSFCLALSRFCPQKPRVQPSHECVCSVVNAREVTRDFNPMGSLHDNWLVRGSILVRAILFREIPVYSSLCLSIVKLRITVLYELKFSRWFYFREFRESNPRENFHFNLCLFIVMTTSAKSRN